MAEEKKEAKPEEKKEDKKKAKEQSDEILSQSEGPKKQAEIPAKFKKLVDEISGLSALELSELVKVFEDHFGVSAAAPAAVAAAPATAEGGEAAAAGKSEYTIVLKDAGDNKINVIKAVREVTGEGLAESKALVDGAPKPLKENVPKDEAEEAKKKLEEAGATVELE